MSNPALYGRVLNVLITSNDPTQLVRINGFDITKNQGFDIDVHVTKDSQRDSNKAVVRIFNLPEDQRRAFQAPGCQFTISAGHQYASDLASLGVFTVRKVFHDVEEADWVTHIEGGEEHNAIIDTRVQASFGPGQTIGTIANTIIKPLVAAGIGIGNFALTVGASTITYPNGYAASGRAQQKLAELARKAGYFFSIQHGEFFFYKPGQGDNTRIVRLSSDTGLLNLPIVGEGDSNKKKQGQVKVLSLCQPGIIPMGYVFIDVPFGFGAAQGQLLVKKVRHNLSTYAQPFYTEAECEVPAQQSGTQNAGQSNLNTAALA